MKALRLLVSGRVQGVGFRHFTRVQARELGLRGTVANLADGRVEIEAAGPPEALAELERRMRSGPRLGRVEAVERTEIPVGDWDDFRVIHK
ncbi:MAG TPA: acylphosphatase [Thermoanaerobaculia bacterium]|nr:acylphosphatase [Thermoanaerobaculia bacterium]